MIMCNDGCEQYLLYYRRRMKYILFFSVWILDVDFAPSNECRGYFVRCLLQGAILYQGMDK